MSLKLSLAATLGLALATPALAQEIHILDTYARAASPMATTGAAFMLIENIGDADDRLIGAKHVAGGDTEDERVADLAGAAGNGYAYGFFHGALLVNEKV